LIIFQLFILQLTQLRKGFFNTKSKFDYVYLQALKSTKFKEKRKFDVSLQIIMLSY